MSSENCGKFSLHARHADPGLRRAARGAERSGQERALRAGAPAALMSGAVDERLDLDPPANVERADALGGIDLVARDGEKIDPELIIDLRRDLADGLGGVGVQEHAALAGDLRDLGDRLDRADLVVRVHDADQTGVAGAALSP